MSLLAIGYVADTVGGG